MSHNSAGKPKSARKPKKHPLYKGWDNMRGQFHVLEEHTKIELGLLEKYVIELSRIPRGRRAESCKQNKTHLDSCPRYDCLSIAYQSPETIRLLDNAEEHIAGQEVLRHSLRQELGEIGHRKWKASRHGGQEMVRLIMKVEELKRDIDKDAKLIKEVRVAVRANVKNFKKENPDLWRTLKEERLRKKAEKRAAQLLEQ